MVAKKVVSPPSSLKFLVEDIPQEGFHLRSAVTREDLELNPDECRIQGEFQLDCDVRHSSEGVCVKGTLAGTVLQVCVRCLSEYQEHIVVPCLGLFQNDQLEKESSTVEFDEESYDLGLDEIEEIYEYQDNFIELDVMLREQVILLAPIQKICHSDCRGLCQHCGISFNQSTCTCHETIRFSPMATALRQLKKNL